MADGRPNYIVLLALVLCLAAQSHGAQQYLGKFLGKLSELHHGVSGEVYAVDARTLHLKDFTYDGEGPAAYFWAGNSRTPGSSGFRVRDENGSGAVLKRYRKKSITITLPDGKNLNNIKWFSVWCDEFAVNFGDVKIPRNFDYPKPQKIEPLRGVHGIASDNIVIVDAQTLLVPNLSYDGEAPDAKFWVGRGSKPSPQGIRVPDENGKEVPLRKYDRKTVVLTLPGDLTVFDIGHFGIWCEAFTVDFGHVRIPQSLNIPPSLKMLGVSPQSKLNCEVLYDELAFEVRWAVAGDSIVLQLVSKLDDGEYMSFGLSGDDSKTQMIGGDVAVAWVDRATLKGYAEDYFLEGKSQCAGRRGSCPDERIAENTNNVRLLNAAMVNGYSIVTYQRPLKASDELDRQIFTNQSQAIIWAIGPLNQRNEVSFHSHYTKKDHFIDFGRPAKWNCPVPESDGAASPDTGDTPVPVQTPAPVKRRKPEVVQAEEEPSYPVEVTTRGRVNERRRGGNRDTIERRRDSQIRERGTSRQEERPTRRRGASDRHTERTTTAITTERARTVPTPKPVTNRNAWNIPAIQCDEPDDGVFYAQMGPTGGKRGYPAITGHVGWGISWYINGLLIPEINVVRGKTYTFVVEGGVDPDVPAKYHPFYITDDSVGGYEHKTPEEKANIRIFAGAKQTRDGKVLPTGVGRLCHWTHTGDKEADDFQSFGAFQRTLELRCDEGEPGVITWTPDADTPDTVYYQCFTHRYLGWKINVVDSCDARAEGSEPEPSWALPDVLADNGDLKSSSSIIVETRIKPNDLFQTTQTKQISDRPVKSERPTTFPDSIDNSYQQQQNSDLGFYQSGPDIISIQPNKYDPLQQQHTYLLDQHDADIRKKYQQNTRVKSPLNNRFQSDFVDRFPFKIVDPSSFPSSYKSKNLTSATTSKYDASETADVSISSPVTPVSSSDNPLDLLPPAKSNPVSPMSFPPGVRPHNKPIYGGNKISLRRPASQNRPPFIIKPIIMSMPRPPAPAQPGSYKKSVYRIPMRKRPPGMRPIPHMHQKLSRPKPSATAAAASHPEPVLIMKHQQIMLKPNTKINHKTDDALPSTQNASTETELVELATENSYHIDMTMNKNYDEMIHSTMRPAINTGFHPESVVIEGGFKPIVHKEFEKRISDEESDDLNDKEDIGVINLNPENTENSQQFTESFEPMFIPSPPDSHLLQNKKQNTTKFSKRRTIIKKNPQMMFIVKHVARSAEPEPEDDLETEEDEVAMAAERVEAYYLPPDDKKSKPIDRIRKPSNIDIPPGSVVTYDGKTVSGTSLTAPVPESGSFESRSSKATELLRLSPQFGPFKGEIPPLDPKNINIANLPQLKPTAVLNRDLNAPVPAPAPSNPSQTTKLTPVKRYQRTSDVRRKRAAHHTAEHTAEQERQRQQEHQHHNQEEHDTHEHLHHDQKHDSNNPGNNSALAKSLPTVSNLLSVIVISLTINNYIRY